MIYASIPIHEQLPVVVNQIRNIIKFLPCKIILHRSKTATFTQEEATQLLSNAEFEDIVFVNNKSVDTAWGSIIAAHLENIRYIKDLGAKPDDKVIFFIIK